MRLGGHSPARTALPLPALKSRPQLEALRHRLHDLHSPMSRIDRLPRAQHSCLLQLLHIAPHRLRITLQRHGGCPIFATVSSSLRWAFAPRANRFLTPSSTLSRMRKKSLKNPSKSACQAPRTPKLPLTPTPPTTSPRKILGMVVMLHGV